LCACGWLAALPGCGGRSDSRISLILLSPHRDEIREEFAEAFRTWFQARSQERLNTASAALTGWLTTPGDHPRQQVEAAYGRLFSDWREQDLPGLRDAYRTWKSDPTPAHGQALRQLSTETADHVPETDVVWQDVGGGTSQIAKYITARFEQAQDAGQAGIDIDVLFGGGTESFVRFANQGLLERLELPPELLKPIPANFHGVPVYDPGGRWFGPMLTSFGILYNRQVLDRLGLPEPPRRWEDLGRAELRGWVTGGDPRLTGSIHLVYEIILQGHGWDEGFRVLLRLGANTHSFIRDSGTLTRMVIMGEVAAAGNIDANALSAVGRDPDMMGFLLPEAEETTAHDGRKLYRGGTVTNPDAVAVLKGAPHAQLARAFVEFTLSEAGQRLILLRPGLPGGPRRYPLCRLSVLPHLYEQYPPNERSVGSANPFAARDALEYNNKLGGLRWDALNDLLGAVIVDAQRDLGAAWRAVLESRLSPEERRRLEDDLFHPPCTEAELLEHARRIVADGPRARLLTVNRWGEQARALYAAVRRAAETRRP
jgi:ABC-type Fe3+ transport system substrate-binding protein